MEEIFLGKNERGLDLLDSENSAISSLKVYLPPVKYKTNVSLFYVKIDPWGWRDHTGGKVLS